VAATAGFSLALSDVEAISVAPLPFNKNAERLSCDLWLSAQSQRYGGA
jgi:hypothetical protein